MLVMLFPPCLQLFRNCGPVDQFYPAIRRDIQMTRDTVRQRVAVLFFTLSFNLDKIQHVQGPSFELHTNTACTGTHFRTAHNIQYI